MNRRSLLQASLTIPCMGALNRWAQAETTQGRTSIAPPPSSFQAALPRWMEISQTPGFGAAVVQNGQVTWQHFAGFADTSAHRSLVPESIFPAASLGKPLFAYAVLQLFGEGKLSLDTPLATYIQNDGPSGEMAQRVTARHVLSHTTGFVNWRNDPGDKLISHFEPGSQFHYSGEGFYLLQRCVEKITGQGCESWMQASVLKPLGMAFSTYLWNDAATKFFVQGYRGSDLFPASDFAPQLYKQIQQDGLPLSTWNHDTIMAVMMKKMPTPRPIPPTDMVPNVASSLLTTVGDYTRFLARIVPSKGGSFGLKPMLREIMLTQRIQINSALGWGLGWGQEQQDNQHYLWQWGDNGGWKNFTLVHPGSHSALVVFTNGSNGMHLAERLVRASTGQDHAAFLWL